MSLVSFWCLYCLLCIYFTRCSSVFIVNFEHIIAGWETSLISLILSLTLMLIISNIYYCYLYYFYYENCYRQFYITVTS